MPHPVTRIMAHRGARNLWPENSLHGFRQILGRGFEAVEFDVHLTQAGELVVIHDARLERTTTGTGPVSQLSPERRRSLRLRGEDGELIDEPPPLLEEVLAVIAEDSTIEPWIELKSDAEGRPYPGLVQAAVTAVRRAGLAHRAALHSFDIDVVREIRRAAPDMRRLLSVNADWAERQGGLEAVLQAADGLVDILGIHHALFTAEFATILKRRPLKACSVWTVNAPEEMAHWLEIGPGFIVSDDPVTLKRLMTQRKS